MTETGTISELIELSMRAERENQAFYTVLAERFVQAGEVAEFWQHYAQEEVGHFRWLEQLRKRCSAAQLDAPADPQIFDQARRASLALSDRARSVRDLQEAYDLANELEHSETNTVFEFLIEHFSRDDYTVKFLREQLHNHASRLTREFPEAYQDVTLRRAVFPTS